MRKRKPRSNLYKYVNEFHGTEYWSNKSPDEIDDLKLKFYSKQNTKGDNVFRWRIWKALCGIDGCQCSDIFGIKQQEK